MPLLCLVVREVVKLTNNLLIISKTKKTKNYVVN